MENKNRRTRRYSRPPPADTENFVAATRSWLPLLITSNARAEPLRGARIDRKTFELVAGAVLRPAVDIAALEGAGTHVSHHGSVIVAQFRCDCDTARRIQSASSQGIGVPAWRKTLLRCRSPPMEPPLWTAFGCRHLMLERGWTSDSRSHRVLRPRGGGRRAALGHIRVLIRPAPALSVDHHAFRSCTAENLVLQPHGMPSGRRQSVAGLPHGQDLDLPCLPA